MKLDVKKNTNVLKFSVCYQNKVYNVLSLQTVNVLMQM